MNQIAFLPVKSDCLKCLYRKGFLALSDAARAMSSVAAVGINYAIQDAIVSANLLSPSFKAGRVLLADLAQIQGQRELPIRVIQAVQTLAQKQIVARARDSDSAFKLALFLPWNLFGNMLTKLLAFGIASLGHTII